MNTVMLLIALVLLLVNSYFFFGKHLSNPVMLFILPLIIALLDGFIYYNQWRYNFNTNTVLLVLGGTVSFAAGCYIAYVYGERNMNPKNVKIVRLLLPNYIYTICIIVILTMSVFVLASLRSLVASHGYSVATLTDIIGNYNELSKFGNEDVSLRGIGAYCYEALFGIGLVLAYLAARDLAVGRKNCSKMCLLAFFTAALSVVIVGSRSVSIALIVSFLVIYIMYTRRIGRVRELSDIKVGYVIFLPLILLVAASVFLGSVSFLGREGGSDNSTKLYDISIYLGAPLKNLDLAMSQGIMQSEYFGRWTFRQIYATLNNLGITSVPYSTDFGFQDINGWFLGNVYTIFYYLTVDFGVLGCFVTLFLIGLLVQFVYQLAYRKLDAPYVSLPVILYGYFAYNILFAFFADNITSLLFSTGLYKKLVIVALVELLLNRILRKRINTYETSDIVDYTRL